MIRADIYRTCRYKNEDYLFHCFEQYSNVVYDQKTGDLDTLDIIKTQLKDTLDKVINHNDPNQQLYVKGLRHALSVVESNMDILRLRENTVRLKEHKCSVCGHDEFVFVEHDSSPKKYDIVCPVCGEVLDTIEEETL